MTTYRMEIWYAATIGEPHGQIEGPLTTEQIEQGVGAFLRDMEYLEGDGCRKFSVEVVKDS